MHINELRVRNFRNLHQARFRFSKGVNTLIGENGSGKTNAFHALRLILDDSLPRNAARLFESDFSRHLGNWQGHWIVISADFKDLDPAEGCQLLKHSAGHMGGDESGTCTLVFRPNEASRRKLFEHSGDSSEITKILAELTLDDYESFLTGRSEGDFLDDRVYEAMAGSFGLHKFPDPDSEDQGVLGVKISALHNEFACTFVRALRDVVSELKGFRRNPLLNLLRGMESSIEIEDANRIVGKVDDLNSDISELPEILKLARGIEDILARTVGHTYGPLISIDSALPSSIDTLLQKLSMLAGDADSAYRGQIHEQSLGAANLIYLALKLLEYEAKISSDKVAHFLLIEEPEAHIHTHIQKSLFGNLPSSRTQVIVSTHSTHISSVAKIGGVNVLAKRNECAEIFQPAYGLSPEQVMGIERYLDAVRSTLLFAKGVLLVEGDAELILLPSILQGAFGLSPDEMGFSVISMDSTVFVHIATLFSEERIQRPCAIVTDEDLPLAELPIEPEEDDKYQRKARNSAIAGQRRKDELSAGFDSNAFVQCFYANNTFEVDFLAAGNQSAIVEVLPRIYSQDARIEDSRAKLNDDSVAVSGSEVLRLAEKLGKGWFAIQVSEAVREDVQIPPYLLNAIAFACSRSIDDRVFIRIAMHRLATGLEDSTGLAGRFAEMSAEEFISEYCLLNPFDQLTLFWVEVERS